MFVSSFGKSGSNIGQFNNPIGLTFDKKGFLYVYDYSNAQIVLYIDCLNNETPTVRVSPPINLQNIIHFMHNK